MRLAGPSTLAAILLAVSVATATAQERFPRIGFTPFNYDIGQASQLDVYARINPRQDVVSHHVDNGVPWPEAYAGLPYDPAVEADLTARLANTPPGTAIYLAAAPLSNNRTGLAAYWGSSANMPRPGEWANKTYDDPMVITAYVNWCRDLIRRFHPRYFNYGVEATELLQNTPADWDRFMVFARAVYTRLKGEFPGLPIFVSCTVRDPGTPEMEHARAGTQQIMQSSDYMAVSSYRYLFGSGADKGNPANLPPGWLQQMADLAPDKPFAVAETGWLAETLSIPASGLYVPGTAAWQDAYLRILLDETDRLHARFVIWFLPVDYDRLWFWLQALGLGDPSWLLWKDTGLWDGRLNARPSLATWDARFARPRRYVPPRIADGRADPGAQLTVARAGAGALTVTWDRGACPAPNHHLVWFDLASIAAYTIVAETCGAGGTGTWTGTPPSGAVAVLAVADDGASVEGSHGVDGLGRERPSRDQYCGLPLKLTDGGCP